jgi:hypothetical protein
MKPPFHELHRFLGWKERFLEDYGELLKEDLTPLRDDLVRETGEEPERRMLLALRAMYRGGKEERLKDPDVKKWTDWAFLKTYKTFNGFPGLSDPELAFVFYGIGKLFVPLLLHQRGVRSEGFKKLSREEQEEAVFEELDTIWETQLTLILQALSFLGLNSITK